MSTLDPKFASLPASEQSSVLTKSAVKKPPMSLGRRMVETGVGMVKGLGHTALELGKVGEQMGGVGVVDRFSPRLAKERKAAEAGIESKLKPSNPSQEAGYGAELIGEYIAPLGEEKLIAGIPKGLQLLSRAGLSAIRTGGTAAVQAGDPKAATAPGLVAGGTTLLFGALSPVMSKLGSKIQFSTIKPSNFDVADGFSTETLKKYGIKGNLEQSFNQVKENLERLRKERNSLLSGKSKVDLSVVFNDAIATAKRNAGKLKYGPAGKELVDQLEKWRDATYSQLGLPKGWTGKVSADVQSAENLKEYMGTMGAWANGGSAADKMTEEAANGLYTRVKDGIETALGPEGPRVRALNGQMKELIPVRNAMFKRIPVEQRRSLITLSDLASTLPAVLTGDMRYLTIEGLKRAQQSLRVGNALVRGAPKAGAAGSVVGRAAGAAVAPSVDEMRRQREHP